MRWCLGNLSLHLSSSCVLMLLLPICISCPLLLLALGGENEPVGATPARRGCLGVSPSKHTALRAEGALLQSHKLGQGREGVSSRDTHGKDQSGASVPWAVLPRCCHPSRQGGRELNILLETTCIERPDSKSPGGLGPSLTHQSVLVVPSVNI